LFGENSDEYKGVQIEKDLERQWYRLYH